MKYVRQFGIIIGITFIGEALKYVLPLPIPASIYGLVLMLAALLTGIVKLEDVEETGDFLVEIMPMLFIPASLGLIDAWGELQNIWLPVVTIIVLTTIIVMLVTGWVAQYMIKKDRKKND